MVLYSVLSYPWAVIIRALIPMRATGVTFFPERTYVGIHTLCTITPISVIVAAYLYTGQVKEAWGAIYCWSGSGSKSVTLSLEIEIRQVNIVLPPFPTGICLFPSILMIIGVHSSVHNRQSPCCTEGMLICQRQISWSHFESFWPKCGRLR